MVWPRPSLIDRAETARGGRERQDGPCRPVAGDVQEVGAFPERVTLGAAHDVRVCVHHDRGGAVHAAWSGACVRPSPDRDAAPPLTGQLPVG